MSSSTWGELVKTINKNSMRWVVTCQLNRNYKEKLKEKIFQISKLESFKFWIVVLKIGNSLSLKEWMLAFMALTWSPIVSPYGKVLFWIFVPNC
jgi:hypothetical protein